ncbi:MAG: AbrB family transcriptional regulator [Alphaproteobacteria bacterium]|nr:AbrB family transcriptional regulator [Alphaproteobacteria bacterium]
MATRLDGIKRDLGRLGVTFALAVVTGVIFLKLGAPAPFLMGSLFGVWMVGASLPKLQPHLGVARWFHIPVVLGLGVLIGSTFTTSALAHALNWWPTVVAMILVTIAVTALGYIVLTRGRGYDPMLAFFCAIPGGQAEAIVLARDHVEKDYVVALFHLIRVAFVFLSTPLLLGFVEGTAAVADSNAKLANMPSLLDLPQRELGLFIAMAIGGYLLARVCRLPLPHLFGPVAVSTIAHAAGVVALPRIYEFVMLAQLSIGGAVGARLAQVQFRELVVYLRDATINTVMILSLYFIAALAIAAMTDRGILQMWLAFVPGGLYEVTLLTLIFGFDIAYVAVHHTIRIMLIFISMPVMARSFSHRSRSTTE